MFSTENFDILLWNTIHCHFMTYRANRYTHFFHTEKLRKFSFFRRSCFQGFVFSLHAQTQNFPVSQSSEVRDPLFRHTQSEVLLLRGRIATLASRLAARRLIGCQHCWVSPIGRLPAGCAAGCPRAALRQEREV